MERKNYERDSIRDWERERDRERDSRDRERERDRDRDLSRDWDRDRQPRDWERESERSQHLVRALSPPILTQPPPPPILSRPNFSGREPIPPINPGIPISNPPGRYGHHLHRSSSPPHSPIRKEPIHYPISVPSYPTRLEEEEIERNSIAVLVDILRNFHSLKLSELNQEFYRITATNRRKYVPVPINQFITHFPEKFKIYNQGGTEPYVTLNSNIFEQKPQISVYSNPPTSSYVPISHPPLPVHSHHIVPPPNEYPIKKTHPVDLRPILRLSDVLNDPYGLVSFLDQQLREGVEKESLQKQIQELVSDIKDIPSFLLEFTGECFRKNKEFLIETFLPVLLRALISVHHIIIESHRTTAREFLKPLSELNMGPDILWNFKNVFQLESPLIPQTPINERSGLLPTPVLKPRIISSEPIPATPLISESEELRKSQTLKSQVVRPEIEKLSPIVQPPPSAKIPTINKPEEVPVEQIEDEEDKEEFEEIEEKKVKQKKKKVPNINKDKITNLKKNQFNKNNANLKRKRNLIQEDQIDSSLTKKRKKKNFKADIGINFEQEKRIQRKKIQEAEQDQDSEEISQSSANRNQPFKIQTSKKILSNEEIEHLFDSTEEKNINSSSHKVAQLESEIQALEKITQESENETSQAHEELLQIQQRIETLRMKASIIGKQLPLYQSMQKTIKKKEMELSQELVSLEAQYKSETDQINIFKKNLDAERKKLIELESKQIVNEV